MASGLCSSLTGLRCWESWGMIWAGTAQVVITALITLKKGREHSGKPDQHKERAGTFCQPDQHKESAGTFCQRDQHKESAGTFCQPDQHKESAGTFCQPDPHWSWFERSPERQMKSVAGSTSTVMLSSAENETGCHSILWFSKLLFISLKIYWDAEQNAAAPPPTPPTPIRLRVMYNPAGIDGMSVNSIVWHFHEPVFQSCNHWCFGLCIWEMVKRWWIKLCSWFSPASTDTSVFSRMVQLSVEQHCEAARQSCSSWSVGCESPENLRGTTPYMDMCTLVYDLCCIRCWPAYFFLVSWQGIPLWCL